AWYEARTGKLLRRCVDPSTSPHLLKQLAFSADGQVLASSNGEIVHLWEVATSKLIHTFKGHQGQINSLVFSRDGRRLASASSDSTVLIWAVAGQPAKATALTEAKLRECWNALAGEDAARAHQAVWTLIRAPRESVPFLKSRLHPAKLRSREQLDRWIQDLDADAFDVRQKAAAELEKLDELAEPALRRALANKPTLELRRRIEPMLAKLEAAIPSGDALRSLRAVRVLEHIDPAKARRLLRELAKGAEGASLTRAAQAALTRIDRPLSKATP
ncbi:MAG: WD40 repeat domain-containing protein, partial [Gemmataceae bacterium]